jgi:putative drug exporter of the RND superfamily
MPFLARWCFRRRWLVFAGWVLALVLLTAMSRAAGISYSTNIALTNSPSAQALAILQHDFPAASGDADQIVVEAKTGPVTSAPVRSEVEAMLAKVQRLPRVASVASPYGPYGASQVSRDGKIAFATVNFDAQARDLPDSAVNAVIHTAQAVQGPDLKVELTGQAIENVLPQKSSNSTLLGVILALIVLGLAFGALFAAITPLVTALVAIGAGYDLTGLLSHVLAIFSFVPKLGLLIGLGVGVDYALFIVTRHRSGVRAGRSIEDAAVNAVNTAGRAVLFAGLTVAIALLGQFALGESFLDGAAVAATVTVALTMLASLTLLPALLGFIGPKVLSRGERQRISQSGPVPEAVTPGPWYRWSRSIERHTALRAAVRLLVMVVVALPVLTLRLGLPGASTDPPSSTTRQAYDLLAQGFGPGFNGPFELVSALHGPAGEAAFARVAEAASRQPGVVAATRPQVSPAGTAAVALLYPGTAPQAAQTAQLLGQFRSQVVPAAEAGSGLHVLIGGATPVQVDFSSDLASKLPLFITVVVILAFLLLMLVFHSLVIPAMASVMNLLSAGAALGVMNAVFHLGVGLAGPRDQRHRAGRGVPAAAHVLRPVRAVHGLRGLPRQPHARVVGPHRRQPGRGHLRPDRDRPGNHRRGQHHDPGVPVVHARRQHHHPAVRGRPRRGDHPRRLHRAHRARARAHAPVRPGQLVAPRLARPPPAAPHSGRPRRPAVPRRGKCPPPVRLALVGIGGP